jgi:ABC-2 type transport system ATP-binding protein
VTENLAIAATSLRREFRDVVAVDDLSLAIPAGSLFGLVGPDGAGKSTLIRMLATVLPPTSGDATIAGFSVTRERDRVKPLIGYMSQRFSMYPDLSITENLEFFAKLRGVPKGERAARTERLLAFSGLAEFADRQAQYLSGGMKQKLQLAATLLHEPDVLFLDEPTTGVDPVSRREFWRIISDLHRAGKTVLVATPYMDEAERCSRIAFMAGGGIVTEDSPAGLKAKVPGRLVELATDAPREAARVVGALPGVIAADLYGDLVRAVVERESGPSDDTLRRAVEDAGVTVRWTRDAAVTMETAFAMLIRAEEVAP